MNYSREEILREVSQFDIDHKRGIETEKRIGDQLRTNKELGINTLKEIVHWKFEDLPGREKRVNNLLKNHTDNDIRSVTEWVLSMPIEQDYFKIKGLMLLKGVGVSLASTILTFYNPQDYCVYDIHVMREVYGKEPKNMFTDPRLYQKLLTDLRKESEKMDLPLRTIEKYIFNKNKTNS